MIDKVVWCDSGWMTIHYGFCPSERAWKREMRRFKLEVEPAYPQEGRGHTGTFVRSTDNSVCCLVTVGDERGRSKTSVTATIYHEAVHVWQAYLEHIGEKNPSDEFEAYHVAYIGQLLLEAYVRTRRGGRW